MKRVTTFLKLAVSLILPLGVGVIAGVYSVKAVPEWYASLNQPSLSPPNWLFGPVWTALYILLGISLFLIWKLDSGKGRNLAIFVFVLQLLLNFGWSFFSFISKRLVLHCLKL
jgi:tryptophan-rich sensory protein